jgi:acyl-CoA thioesterase FadM
LQLTVWAAPEGRARLRCSVEIQHGETGKPVARGYTIHGFTDAQGRPIRPPAWFWETFQQALAAQEKAAG